MSSTQPRGHVAQHEAWELPGPDGTESWVREDGRFTTVRVGQKRLHLAEPSFDADQLRLRRSRCPHPGPWPNAFVFCPDCGARLEEAPNPDASAGWPRRAAPTRGLPVLGQTLQPLVETRRDEAMPAAAALVFVVAGSPPHLFAFDLRSGWLRARREEDRAWMDLQRLAPAGLPRWSWAAAVLGGTGARGQGPQGFVLPTVQGPVLVRIAPDEDLATVAADPALGIKAAAGGVVCLRGRAIMPVRMTGGVALAVLDPDGRDWQLMALPGEEGRLAEDELFAPPVVHDDDGFWCGGGGLLSVSARQHGLDIAYRPWRDALSPILGTRPLQAPDGRLYQLMRLGEDSLVFEGLALPGQVQERRPSSSLWMSSGNAAFVEGRRRRLPWEEAMGRAEYVLKDGEFVLPLLAFDDRRFLVATCPGRPTLNRFLDTAGEASEARPCQLHFTAATRVLTSLQRRIEARSPADIVCFVFRCRLFVYAASTNQCWSWELQPVEAD